MMWNEWLRHVRYVVRLNPDFTNHRRQIWLKVLSLLNSEVWISKVLCLWRLKSITFFNCCYEFSRFPFEFSCRDVGSRTVISCLNSLFSLFGFPAIVHSDNAKCFVSKEIKMFFNEREILSTYSFVYKPRNNSQCERFNGMIWNTIKLALPTRGLKTFHGKW